MKKIVIYLVNGTSRTKCWDKPMEKKLYKMETNRTKWRFVAGRLSMISMENSL